MVHFYLAGFEFMRECGQGHTVNTTTHGNGRIGNFVNSSNQTINYDLKRVHDDFLDMASALIRSRLRYPRTCFKESDSTLAL